MVYLYILTYSLNLNLFHTHNMIFTQIVITNFDEKLRELSFKFFSKIQIMKDVFKNPRNQPILKY